MDKAHACVTCAGSGETPTDYGPADCPDCGGSGALPPRSVLVEWRCRDIERAVERGAMPDSADVRWLLAELRSARGALTEVIALAHDVDDADQIALRIRFAANRALRLYDPSGSPGLEARVR